MTKPTYQYKTYVDKNAIVIQQEPGYRYSLFIPFKNSVSSKRVMVIMRNPSKANEKVSDKTVNNVLQFCQDKYKSVYLHNLYPYYETNSTQIKAFIDSTDYYEKMEKNEEALKDMLQQVDEVIVAWGSSSAGTKYQDNYDKTKNKVLKIVKQAGKSISAMRFSVSENPWHPRNWGAGYSLELYPYSE